ncbi:MAG: hypothetical protein L0228_14455 [Planctomycetes bacterium]|nr:hypothetical protein [Planctomycetota bacterium]
MELMQGIVVKLHQRHVGGSGFPPSVNRTEDGQIGCSWRREIKSNPFYGTPIDQFWKSPYTQIEGGELIDNDGYRQAFTVKGRPSEHTQIFALIGPDTAFTEYAVGTGRDSNTAEPDAILLIDCQNRLVHWMEPGDIEVNRLLSPDIEIGESLAPNYEQGFLFAFVDGAVWWIRKDVPQKVIAPFLTLEGARTHDRDDELAKFALDKLPPSKSATASTARRQSNPNSCDRLSAQLLSTRQIAKVASCTKRMRNASC